MSLIMNDVETLSSPDLRALWAYMQEQHNWVALPEDLPAFARASVKFSEEVVAEVEEFMSKTADEVVAENAWYILGNLPDVKHVAVSVRRTDWMGLGTRRLSARDKAQAYRDMDTDVIERVSRYMHWDEEENPEFIWVVHILSDSLSTRQWAKDQFSEQIQKCRVTLGMNQEEDFSVRARGNWNTPVRGCVLDYGLAGLSDDLHATPGTSVVQVRKAWFQKDFEPLWLHPDCAKGVEGWRGDGGVSKQ